MRNLTADFLFSLRLLSKTPVFSIVCVVVVALGLAVAICNYAFFYEFTKAPPFPDGDRFFGVKVFDSTRGGEISPNHFNGYAFNRIKDRTNSFEEVGVFDWLSVNIASEDSVTRVDLVDIPPHLMRMTTIQPQLGRLFDEGDFNGRSDPVILISYSLWQNEFAGRDNIVGSRALVNGVSHTIIGVMSQDFHFPFSQQIWRPLQVTSAATISDEAHYRIIGKLKAKATFESATADINRAMESLRNELPQDYLNILLNVSPFNAMKTQGAEGTGGLLNALTIVMFLLASLNLSTLLFARAAERSQELAVRNAVGASAWQLRKQLLLESGLLCLTGSVAALLISIVLMNITQTYVLKMLESLGATIDLNFKVHTAAIMYAAAMMLAIWLLSSFATAYKIGKVDLRQSLEGNSRGATSHSKSIATRTIIGVEVVSSCFLLIVCGLLTMAIIDSSRINFGTSADNLVVAEIALALPEYQTPSGRNQFLTALGQAVDSHPDFRSVSFTNDPPGGWEAPPSSTYILDTADVKKEEVYPTVGVGAVSANYFTMIGVRVLDGRNFDSGDVKGAENVVIVDELLAATLWPNKSALNKRLQIDPEQNGEWLTVVGVNSHIIQGQPIGDSILKPTIYRPIKQIQPGRLYMIVQSNSDQPLNQITRSLQQIVKDIDRNIPLQQVDYLVDHQPQGLAFVNLLGGIVAWLGLVTLFLSSIGVYGLVARSVLLRTREIGVRRAMGSSNIGIAKIFLHQGLIYLLIGAVAGGGGAVLMSSVMSALFPDLLNGIGIVLATVIAVMGLLLLLASFIPARKVIGMEPGDSLRYD